MSSVERVFSALMPCGRRSKWLVLAAWLILAAVAVPLAGGLAGAQKNEFTQALPSGAQSTAVAELADRFAGGDDLSGVVVYARDGKLTDSDLAKVNGDRARISALTGRTVPAAIPAEDGKALSLPVILDGDAKPRDIKEVRTQVEDNLPDGLEARLTGAAGDKLDSTDAFGGVETTLLYVAAGVVALLLLLIYRSPVLWILPLVVAGVTAELAKAVVYLLAVHAGMVVNSQGAAILLVLVFGAGTDYALLLLSRYREELRAHEDRHDAMKTALRKSSTTIAASAATVCLALLCLLAAELKSNRALGPVAAVGITCALLATLTLLPALLVLCGRWIFWPLVPRHNAPVAEKPTLWARIGTGVTARPRVSWVAALLVLGALAMGSMGVKTGLDYKHIYRTETGSVTGQQLLARHYPGGAARPARVIVDAEYAAEAAQRLRVEGTAAVQQPRLSTDGELASLSVILSDASNSPEAQDTIDRMRTAAAAIPEAHVLVGGNTAATLDVARAQDHDRKVIIPLALAVTMLVLIILLRSLLAPLILVGAVVVSYFATLGASWLLFRHVFDWPAVDTSLVLYGFIFLVALGVDYTIFLVDRMREEAAHGTPREAVRRAFAATGGVILSAGTVLAATFAVLAVLPLVAMAEIGVMVGLGVLLEVLLVITVLVPGLATDIGRRFWWPNKLARRSKGATDLHVEKNDSDEAQAPAGGPVRV
ncbi:MMPL family transporter [Streptomyces sp. NBC_00555]|uniref:MMPL family transporter n=1 Tax=Streptomyces sp. NBC_00555 TaxID=2903662 RepID=UPI0022528C07|nr:MMPL family transporter [Streptomyces sp. NBC_00555]MCX5011207.1 MMPL family transporter [Streptomyces sp. NBC_00555]